MSNTDNAMTQFASIAAGEFPKTYHTVCSNVNMAGWIVSADMAYPNETGNDLLKLANDTLDNPAGAQEESDELMTGFIAAMRTMSQYSSKEQFDKLESELIKNHIRAAEVLTK